MLPPILPVTEVMEGPHHCCSRSPACTEVPQQHRTNGQSVNRSKCALCLKPTLSAPQRPQDGDTGLSRPQSLHHLVCGFGSHFAHRMGVSCRHLPPRLFPECDSTCVGCTGEGPGQCKECLPGYSKESGQCAGQRAHLRSTRGREPSQRPCALVGTGPWAADSDSHAPMGVGAEQGPAGSVWASTSTVKPGWNPGGEPPGSRPHVCLDHLFFPPPTAWLWGSC